MEKNNFWTVVVIALVVAVVASLVTVKLTGNIVKVPTTVSATQTDVYTKAEIDKQLIAIEGSIKGANANIDNKLGRVCSPKIILNGASSGNLLCDQQKCVLSLKQKSQTLSSGVTDRQDILVPCSENVTAGSFSNGAMIYSLSAVCCN